MTTITIYIENTNARRCRKGILFVELLLFRVCVWYFIFKYIFKGGIGILIAIYICSTLYTTVHTSAIVVDSDNNPNK